MASADELFAEGNRLLNNRQIAEAIHCYELAIAQQPQFPEALCNLATALAESGRHEEALRWYDMAIALRPNFPNVHFNRSNSLAALNRMGEALASVERALALDPQFVEAWSNRGVLLRKMGHVPEAFECHRRAMQLRPDSSPVHSNIGLCYGSLGRAEQAIDHYDRALQLQSDNVGARCNRAQQYLLKADFRRGWPEYESRWQLERAKLPDRGLPRWDGSSLQGRTILLRHEQGFGDTIMCCRFAPLVKARGGRTVVECPKRLHRLMQTCDGIDAMIDTDEPVDDLSCEAPILSLPGIFETSLRTIPKTIPYLSAELERIEKWRDRLPKEGMRIGIAWQGNPDYPEDAMRSIPLRHFAPLASMPGVTLVSLQMGKGVEQIAPLRERLPFVELGPSLDADGAFVDTAAVIMNLDLIVTSDTAIVHLAGALGRPVWLALTIGPEWRWLRDRDDSPWYPTARLFRQESYGDWDGVFARIREAVAQFRAER